MLAGILDGGPCQSIIDVGAGDGRWGKLIRVWAPRMHANVQRLVGLEIWPRYVKKYHLESIYDEVIISDLRCYLYWDQFDVVILGDVLEHLYQLAAYNFVELLKKQRARVYLTIPITPCPQNGTVYSNPYETHLYQWTHEELEHYGWKELHQGPNPNGLVTIGTYELGRESTCQ